MITEGEWRSISEAIASAVSKKGEYFVTGKVIKRDVNKKLVWMAEFGDQAIPIVAFDYMVKYYDTDALGTVHAKEAKVTPVVPAVGSTVLVAREWGQRRLPRCLGVVQGVGWITRTED